MNDRLGVGNLLPRTHVLHGFWVGIPRPSGPVPLASHIRPAPSQRKGFEHDVMWERLVRPCPQAGVQTTLRSSIHLR